MLINIKQKNILNIFVLTYKKKKALAFIFALETQEISRYNKSNLPNAHAILFIRSGLTYLLYRYPNTSKTNIIKFYAFLMP